MPNIYLIGPRACGKTTVGRILAEKLQFEFYDSDALLVQRAGCEIAEYVDSYGWDGFRNLESEVLLDLSQEENSVISCGGGIVVRQENLDVLRDNFTVYIKVGVQELVKRLQTDPNHEQRPSLTGKSLLDEVQDVLNSREELYAGCASLTVDGAASINDVCNQILTGYESYR